MKSFRNVALGLVLGFGMTVFAQGTVFPDVQLSDWFAPYVNEIKDWGVVSGNDDGTFAPARNINRAEFSKMLVLYDERVDAKIADIDIPEPATSTNLPSVMYLDIENSNVEPSTCPENWDEVGLNRVWDTDDTNFRRTCVTDQACETIYLDDRDVPAACPAGWTEAQFSALNRKNFRRTCYICQ